MAIGLDVELLALQDVAEVLAYFGDIVGSGVVEKLLEGALEQEDDCIVPIENVLQVHALQVLNELDAVLLLLHVRQLHALIVHLQPYVVPH